MLLLQVMMVAKFKDKKANFVNIKISFMLLLQMNMVAIFKMRNKISDSSISQFYLRGILGLYKSYLGQIPGLSQAYLMYISLGISQAYLKNYTGKF